MVEYLLRSLVVVTAALIEYTSCQEVCGWPGSMGKWARPGDSVVKAMERGHDQPQWRIILNVAGQNIRSYEAQLEAYLAEVRRAHRECSSELTEIERQLKEASASLEQLSRATDAAQMNTEQTVQVVELSERRQALRQQQTWLAERLVDLLNTARKLQAVIRQSQISSRYLETDTGEVEADDGQLDSRCQLRAIEAQEEERLRLAREIHDGPAQVLANAIFEIEYCQRLLNRDPERLSTELERLKIDLKEGLAEVRQFIMDLRPGPLAELGLIATIRRYAQNYESRFGIVVELALDEDLGRLLPTQEVGVFRVVQEALQNARRHSGATRVRLAMRRQEGCICTAVEDNGYGFDLNKAEGSSRHFGLKSMQERARLMRGELHISSQAGIGTSVRLEVPIGQGTSL